MPLTLLFVVINIIAQEHLSFKGIPIERSMTEFCQKLKTKGFTQIGHDNNVTLFTGDFTGRNSTVGVGATDDGKSVHSVIVIFDESSEWNTLVNTYDYYKGHIFVSMESLQLVENIIRTVKTVTFLFCTN